MIKDWDHSIAVGDLVTGYHKGIWRVTEVERRLDEGDLVHYQHVLTDDYQKGRNIIKSCDVSYCHKIDDAFIDERQAELEAQIKALENLRKIMKESSNGT